MVFHSDTNVEMLHSIKKMRNIQIYTVAQMLTILS